MERMEIDMERDRRMMKIRQSKAHKRLNHTKKVKQKKKTSILSSHPYNSPADDFNNKYARKKSGKKKRKKKVRQEEQTSYAEDDTEDLVASTLREAEQWRTAIAEQEEQELQESQYQGHNSPLSDEEQHLGSTLLGYELRRMRTNVAPQLDSVLGYSEEPQ